LNTSVSQGSVTTHLRCGEIINNLFETITGESDSERIFENWKTFVKVIYWQEQNVLF